MKRYDLELTATGPVMEEREQGAFVPFSEVGPLKQRINQLLEERIGTGLAISNAILVGVVPDKHPLRSRLELLANHRKMLIEKSELCDDLLDLIERMVNCMGLAGEEPEKDSYNPIKAWMYDAITTMAGQRPKQSVAVTETIRTAPERIWLQVGDQSSDGDYPFPEHHDEVTWCSDSVVSCEVPYVRADLVGNSEQQRDMVHGADTCQRKAMSLDEAIQHAIEKSNSGGECAEQHIQLAIWLGHYQAMLEAKPQGRLITEGQEFELTTVLQSIVNGFSDDPAHDAAALLKRITGEVPWTGDSFQLPPRQGGEQIVKCPHCNAEFQDGSDAAEFIGWHGLCSSCELKGGEPCATEPPSSNPA